MKTEAQNMHINGVTVNGICVSFDIENVSSISEKGIKSAKAGDRRKRICGACYGDIFWDGPDVPVAGLGDTAHDRSSCAPDHAGIGRLNFKNGIF